ncbi:efflux RND transporter permease subunit [Acidiphilium acidophilum]|uniref:efflux RND transporter permease subunit n=1 Tax=Acidiphilium acidophilum TaxID=76588 RepID=UPI002E8E6F1E|nr:efflux RND transporter permease subunit [Acidiphilium acidophilum]
MGRKQWQRGGLTSLPRRRLALFGTFDQPFTVQNGLANVSGGAMVGFVTLFGIALRNSLMLMIHYGRLVRDHGQRWDATTVRQGPMDRLPAILITAIVTGLGLLPLALSAGTSLVTDLYERWMLQSSVNKSQL